MDSASVFAEGLTKETVLAQQRELIRLGSDLVRTRQKYQRAIWFLQDIANMSKKIGSETAAHALAQLGEPRERNDE